MSNIYTPRLKVSDIAIRVALVRFATGSCECMQAMNGIKQLTEVSPEQLSGVRTQLLRVIESAEQTLSIVEQLSQPKSETV